MLLRVDWSRRLILLAVMGAGLGVAWWSLKEGGNEDSERWRGGGRVGGESVDRVYGQEGKLVVTRMDFEGDADSEKLKVVLGGLERRKYGPTGRVDFVAMDVMANRGYLLREGVKVDAPGACVDFHSAGVRLGRLVGTTDEATLDRAIERFLKAIDERTELEFSPAGVEEALIGVEGEGQ